MCVWDALSILMDKCMYEYMYEKNVDVNLY